MNRPPWRDTVVVVIVAVLVLLVIAGQWEDRQRTARDSQRIEQLQDVNADLVERVGQVKELLDFQVNRAERADCIAEAQRRWFVAVSVALIVDRTDPAAAETARAELVASSQALVDAPTACENGS